MSWSFNQSDHIQPNPYTQHDLNTFLPVMVIFSSASPAPRGSTVNKAGLLTGTSRSPSPDAVHRLPSIISQSYGVPV